MEEGGPGQQRNKVLMPMCNLCNQLLELDQCQVQSAAWACNTGAASSRERPG